MKIAAAQTKPFKGDIQKNIEQHIKFIGRAATKGAEMIIFPELSLTGYEPELAAVLATEPGDKRFTVFQEISDAHQMVIGTGTPLKNETGITINMLLFEPGKKAQVYSKKYIHTDEEPFFVSGRNSDYVLYNYPSIAPAICYELSVPEHAEHAHQLGAHIYIASAAKTLGGVTRAIDRLSEIARTYSMTVLLSNCIGLNGGDECAGKSSAWNNKGVLLGQLNETEEGILLLDTDTEETIIIRETH